MRPMRAFIVLACLVLAACSSTDYKPPPVSAPDRETATKTAKTASNEEKLVGSVEVSAVREAHPVSPGPYILCIRGAESATARHRTYAVFFKNNDYVGARMSVMIDSCEKQPFTPLGTGPFPSPDKAKGPS
jgi:hypothetical protein